MEGRVRKKQPQNGYARRGGVEHPWKKWFSGREGQHDSTPLRGTRTAV